MIQFVCLGTSIAALVFGAIAFVAKQKHRHILDISITDIGSIEKPGFYGVSGTVTCDESIPLPDRDIQCVWFKRYVCEQVKDRIMGRLKVKWQVVSDQTLNSPFFIEDESGTISIEELEKMKKGEMK